jgi:hypothetical protein
MLNKNWKKNEKEVESVRKRRRSSKEKNKMCVCAREEAK